LGGAHFGFAKGAGASYKQGMSRALITGLFLGMSTVFAQVTVVDTPDTTYPNRHYPGNRAPLLPSPFVRLPVGSVHPEGWVRKQLELQSAGFHGHLTEISDFLKKEDNAWLSPTGQGKRGWEEVPYWLKGFADCAYLLKNEEQIKEARLWIEGAIQSQQEDGFFGPRGKGAQATVDSTKGKFDLWPNMVMLQCLQSYYEVSKDKRVIELMRKYFKWELEVAEEDFLPPYWQHIRAGDNLYSVLWLYNVTGETWLLDLAHKIYRHTANWTSGLIDWHNVNIAQGFGSPTFYWPLSREPRHLTASDYNWRKIRELYGQVPGGMYGSDENCRPGYFDPRQAVETCGLVEMMFSCERLLAVTGNPVWADRCEDVAFNSLPAALTADFKALRYLTAPNQVLSDRGNKAPGIQNGGPMFHMDPHNHRCCQHNFGHGWPYLAEHLWMATAGNGLAAALYGPSVVEAWAGPGVQVKITEETKYPFEEDVRFRIQTPQTVEFPLYLRVPGWCQAPKLKLNGKAVKVAARPSSYVRIERAWANGDSLEWTMPMQVSLRTWATNQNSISVDRGPLTYSLKIAENVIQEGGTPAWPAWEIHPSSPWNYGLVLASSRPERSFELVRKPWPGSDLPFTLDGAPLELRVKAKRIPEWQADRLGLVGKLQPSPVKSTSAVETVTLVPMGAARLRVSAFPVIGEGKDAHVWQGSASPALKATASHTNGSDTTDALQDGVLPQNSNDRGLERFTWWDHKGTTEWVQYEFPKARPVKGVSVYWFDDAPGGGCAVPASWKVLYRAGGEWKEAPNAKVDPVTKDQFNKAAFDAVETDALRLEVKLQPDRSGGILEWQVE